MKELQGALGLVDEDDGMVALLDAADGFVRVVCAKAPSESRQTVAIMAHKACGTPARMPYFQFLAPVLVSCAADACTLSAHFAC